MMPLTVFDQTILEHGHKTDQANTLKPPPPSFFFITKVCGGAVCRPLRCSKISHRQSVAASSNGRTLRIAVLDSCRRIFSFHFYLLFSRFLFVCICVSVCSVFHFRISSIVSLELS